MTSPVMIGCETCGLLCHNCNMALGMLGDDVDTVWALIEYLLAHQQKRESRAV